MRRDDILDQLDYLFWLRDRILAAAARLTDDGFRSAESVTTRSLRETLVHQLECEWAWRIRLAEGAFPDGSAFVAADFPTVAALAERWRLEEQALRRWMDGVSEADLAMPPPGDVDGLPRSRALLYVVNHGTQQFAEAAVLLTRAGQSPGEIGYLEYSLERSRAVR